MVRKLRCKDVKRFIQRHLTGKWSSPEVKPVFRSQISVLTQYTMCFKLLLILYWSRMPMQKSTASWEQLWAMVACARLWCQHPREGSERDSTLKPPWLHSHDHPVPGSTSTAAEHFVSFWVSWSNRILCLASFVSMSLLIFHVHCRILFDGETVSSLTCLIYLRWTFG